MKTKTKKEETMRTLIIGIFLLISNSAFSGQQQQSLRHEGSYTIIVESERGDTTELNCSTSSTLCSYSNGNGAQQSQAQRINPLELTGKQVRKLRGRKIYIEDDNCDRMQQCQQQQYHNQHMRNQGQGNQ